MNFEYEVNMLEYCSEIVASDQMEGLIKKLVARSEPWFIVHDRPDEITVIAPATDVDFTSTSLKLFRFLEAASSPTALNFRFRVTEALASAGVNFTPMISHETYFVLVSSEDFSVAEKAIKAIGKSHK